MSELVPALHRRVPYLCLSYVCIALGAAGVILPLLPTTPFLLLAAWSASRGSPRLDRWLRQHPRFGPVLRAWREERAVPLRAKKLAVALLASSWAILWLTGAPGWLLLGTAGLFLCVGGFVCTRPSPYRPRSTI
ncbi:hypothetical protein CAI21_08765 [Alkalilimnicola ehrlichii]|uniref:Inner membrane protein n=1 Tax=Alkalilimnicola ehrlichii TaxID=351052 RepID=A0A3E0WX50_9GAMM|nr:YbaN family protein [Alkalilimnicola ehrlichii]RFA29909.1 hypothetical protein CAI21_08765 [Alkalilimnicola ehrlichii]RFA36497.1 hypothetical protein CAL65_11040 [Alkalilimnicola ehrlichii]